jgi:hypothetical protein
MSGHTPGPWKVQDDRTTDGTFRVFPHEGPSICNLRHGEMEANARLIAAAPELLRACEEALNALLDYVPLLEAHGSVMGYGHAVIVRLKAAIAKAEGK